MKKLLPLFLVFLVHAAQGQELSADETKALLSRIAAARGGASYQTDFREEKTLAVAQQPVVESGTLAFSPPNNFRREVKGKSLTVCNGETLWLYYPSFNQAEKYSLQANRTLKATFDAMSSGLSLQEGLLKTYDVTATKIGDGYQLVLVPKSNALKRMTSRITLDLTPGLSARQMKIESSRDESSLITFSNEKRVKLSADDFNFQPPAGATISEPLAR